jgi:hypothetical protein
MGLGDEVEVTSPELEWAKREKRSIEVHFECDGVGCVGECAGLGSGEVVPASVTWVCVVEVLETFCCYLVGKEIDI